VKYSKTNNVDGATISTTNVGSTVGSSSNLFDSRTTRSYGLARTADANIELSEAFDNDPSRPTRTIDLVSLVGTTGLFGGPAAWYKLNGGATDATENGYDGTGSGPTYEDGKTWQAARFDGTDDYISLPSGAQAIIGEAGPWTISAWANPDDPYAGDADGAIFATTGTGYVRLYFDSANTRAVAVINDGTTSYTSVTANGSMPVGSWAHVVMTFDGSDIALYLGGTQIDTDSYGGSGLVVSSAYIGGESTALSFDGLIDEVRIYNRVLTTSEISALNSTPAAALNAGRVEIELYTDDVLQDSAVATLSQPLEQTYFVAAFDSVEADEVVVRFYVAGDEPVYIGYLFAGETSDVITIASESLNYAINSTSPAVVSRAGTAITGIGYLYATVDISTSEMTFSTFREMLATILEAGYAVPRLWYFDETCIMTGEAIYAILDASAAQLDPTWHKDEAKARTTIGLTEVF